MSFTFLNNILIICRYPRNICVFELKGHWLVCLIETSYTKLHSHIETKIKVKLIRGRGVLSVLR